MDHSTISSSVIQGITSVATFLAGFASAVLAEPARKWIFRPKLVLEYTGGRDCLTETPMSSGISATYVRIKITNKTRRLARACRVFLVNIETADSVGEFRPTIFADSLQLAWSCQEPGHERRALDLVHGVAQYADVVMAPQGGNRLEPQVAPLPMRYVPLFPKSPATFRFTIQASGDEADPIQLRLIVEWTGQWNTIQARTEAA